MSYPNALYTMTFKEFLDDEINDAWFDSVFILTTNDRSNALKLAMQSMWNSYEIAGETIGEFKMFLNDTFNQHKQYYEEMITAYDKEYDYATGTQRVVATVGSTKDVHVELPNKQIDANNIFKYPNDANKNDYADTVTETNNDRFLEMKRRYMSQVRNLYNEFAGKFKDCFIHLFGGSMYE